MKLLCKRTTLDYRYLELENDADFKSGMRENGIYGFVGGIDKPFTIHEFEKGVSRLSTRRSNMNYAYEILIRVLNDNFGILILNDEQEDFSISEYIYESITFIQFIIAIEEELGKDLPDDFLNIEILDSARGFAEMLDSYIKII